MQYAVGAFLLWAIFPIYFKWMGGISPFEILAHRIIWGSLFTLGLVLARGEGRQLKEVFVHPKHLLLCLLSGTLIACNWLLFVLAVSHDLILESSLAYFLCPLLTVFLGVIVLGERMTRVQWVAVTLAGLGVTHLALGYGSVPWYALGLANTFALYALVRKRAPFSALTGLTIETLVLSPIALAYGVYLYETGTASFGTDIISTTLLVGVGAVTALPLLLFTQGARQIKLSTAGILQYITPIGHFLLAVYVYDEPMSRDHWIAFVLVWLAVALFVTPMVAQVRGSLSLGLRGHHEERRTHGSHQPP